MTDLHAIGTISYTDSRYNNQVNIISTPCQMKESAYAVGLRKDRERWSTWASWAGGSPGPTNSSTVEDVRQGMLSRMDLLPTSRKEKVHRIAVLHEETIPGVPAAPIYDTQKSEEGAESREAGEINASRSTPHIVFRSCRRRS